MLRAIIRTLPATLLLLTSLAPRDTHAVIAAGWQVLAPWDPTTTGNYATSVAVDAAGDIFTVYYSDAVVEIVPNGEPRFWGGRGLAPGEFLNAAGVALGASGALYVTNIDSTYTRSSCIEKLDSP